MKIDSTSPTEALAEFASSLSLDDVPRRTATLAKRIILDTLGCALAATALGDGCRETVRVMQRLGGPPESTILGAGTKVAAPHAAFANGALAHALNYDPIGIEIGHLGVVALAAPLAMAEAKPGMPGAHFLAASIAACEVCARVNAAIARTGRKVSDRFLAGQLLSYFGAVAGAGRALGLTTRRMHSAFGLALMQMAGSRQLVLQGDPSAKAIYGAFPSQAGVMAARLAEAGLDADCDVFGAPAGLYAMIYDGQCDESALTNGLGAEFLLEQVEFKLWPVSNKVNPFVEAALEIVRSGMAPTDIQSIAIHGAEALRPWCEPVERRRYPDNAAAAANSIPFCVAKACARGELGLRDVVPPEALRDPLTGGLAERTECHLEGEGRESTVSVTLHDGRRFTACVETPLGSPSRPLPEERLVGKFVDCCSYATRPMGEAAIGQVIEMVMTIETLDDINRLTALLHPA